ncbi:hypothetical protein Cgig2_011586 [Carnegiea gigantea]|uniref:Retrotransposon gag domain-containing protein n=1 Tax=Carnegiea gigantea TaxID=171969 RepID=A0A9Q1QDY9_9CARY|nr:hypothetical protein Cgig2_011586 [Carnegiea gigantea]
MKGYSKLSILVGPSVLQGLVDFLKIAPKHLVGTTNPIEGENWIDEIENAFQCSQYSEREKFYAKYFPSSRMREMEKEFIGLSQCNRTVDEYEAEFDRLSRFALMLVADKQSKMMRFEEGLNNNVRRLFAYVRPKSFIDLVNRAQNVYLILKETEERKFGDHKKKGRGFDALNNHGKGEFSKPKSSISPLVMALTLRE